MANNSDIKKNLMEIKLFDEVSLSDIIKEVYVQSVEEREEALSAFKEFKAMIKEEDDLFMLGDHPQKYLKISQESTDNLIRLLSATKQLLDLQAKENSQEKGFSPEDVINVLEKRKIGPKRFMNQKEAAEKDVKKDKSLEKKKLLEG